jgi:hypothetical protein
MASVEEPYVQNFTGNRPDIRRDLPNAFGQYAQATSGTMDNSMKPRTFSAITLMPTGNGKASVRIMNLNTGKVCTRTPSQITQPSMPQEWIEILLLWANVSGKRRATETHWEYRGHVLSEDTRPIWVPILQKLSTFKMKE